MPTKIVQCGTCRQPVTVSTRSRARDWYHEDCRPTCDLPGCNTPTTGIGSRCWVHRHYDVAT